MVRTTPDMTNMIPVTYGYARVSKSDRDDRNLVTQLRELASHGIRQGAHLLRRDDRPPDVAAWLGRTNGPGPAQRHHRRGLAGPLQPELRRGRANPGDLTNRNIGIVAIKESIDTTEDGAAAKYFRRMMMANGAYQADSTSERIKVGQDRAKAEGRPSGRPPALTPDQVNECKRMFAENPSVSRVVRIMKISWSTANKAIFDESSAQGRMR